MSSTNLSVADPIPVVYSNFQGEPDDLTQRIVAFTQSYVPALNAKMDDLGRDNFPYHSDPIEVVFIVKSSNGYLTFYMPADPDGVIPPSIRARDLSDFSMDRYCAAHHLTFFRVPDAIEIGKPYVPPKIPPDAAEPIPEKPYFFFHPDVHAWMKQRIEDKKPINLTGLAIFPHIHVTGGIVTKHYPTRQAIWSPVFPFDGIGHRRQFIWLRMDIWQQPEQLNIDASKAAEIAEQDAIAFLTILKSVPSFDRDQAQKPASSNAANLLEASCQEFLDLLDSKGNDEEEIHKWLNIKSHHVFLDPHAVQVWSKLRFGSKFSDFVIRRPNNTYSIIEIERANVQFFTPTGQEPSFEFNHACQQVRDWRQYIRENTHTVRDTLKLPDIYEPEGVVILGRTRDIQGDEALRRWRDMKNDHDFRLFSYDDLVDRVKALAATLRHQFGQ